MGCFSCLFLCFIVSNNAPFMLLFSILSGTQGQMLVHLCLSVLLTVISLIVFTCTVTYELINDDDDDDDDDDDENGPSEP